VELTRTHPEQPQDHAGIAGAEASGREPVADRFNDKTDTAFDRLDANLP
jgi:hypothetical protein